MIDIHPPQHAPMTLREFFIHLFIVVLGILIAIGLEQSVEYLHHHHQRSELNEQMRAEAQRNLVVERDTLQMVTSIYAHMSQLNAALASAKVSGNMVEVISPPQMRAVPSLIISPSRGTWTAAQAAGVVALLPPEQMKIYARLDYNAEEEVKAEDVMVDRVSAFESECNRAAFSLSRVGANRISLAHRDDLLFNLTQMENATKNMAFRLAVMEGADQAIVNGIHSLDEMYPYQTRIVEELHISGSFARVMGQSPMPTDRP